VEHLPLVVIKKDGSRQSFDKVKIINGMVRACEKRPVSLAVIEKIADEIEQEAQNSLDREIPTSYIGELVMDNLKGIDEVAYVRFASVYRQFKDINSFVTELNNLLVEK
jgi:transcriptional repressor NrdR